MTTHDHIPRRPVVIEPKNTQKLGEVFPLSILLVEDKECKKYFLFSFYKNTIFKIIIEIK